MKEKEIAEIRRRYRSDKSNISRISGCYVNDKKEIISEFDQSLGMMSEDDANGMLTLLKKVLSGHIGTNLLEIDFTTEQVNGGEEYALLSKLKQTELKDGEARGALYNKIIENLEFSGSYLILLAHDNYDVFDLNADYRITTAVRAIVSVYEIHQLFNRFAFTFDKRVGVGHKAALPANPTVVSKSSQAVIDTE